MKMACPYTPGRELGRGTFGRVVMVQDGTNVSALKIVTYPQFEINNLQEIDFLARIRHPNIIRATGLVGNSLCPTIVNPDQIGLVLPLAQADLQTAFDTMSYKERLTVFFQLASAVKFLHDNNILHLDIKPANALLINGQAVISDLGLSRVVADVRKGFYLPGFVGTLVYSPPEVLSNDAAVFTNKTDVWALGMSFLVMLTNNHPLLGARDLPAITNAIQTIFGTGQHRHILRYIRGIPEEYVAGTYHLLAGMLKVDPDERWDMDAVVSADIFQQLGFTAPIPGRMGQVSINPAPLTPLQITGLRQIVDTIAPYGNVPVEAIFVGLDLGARVLPTIVPQDVPTIQLAGEVIGRMVLSLYNVIIPNMYGPRLLTMEQSILTNAAGIIRRDFIFEAANSLGQVEEIKRLLTGATIANYPSISAATFFANSTIPPNPESKDTVISQTTYGTGAWF